MTSSPAAVIFKNEHDEFWQSANQLARLSGMVVTVLGLIANYLSYLTAFELGQSNSANLMKHLAMWDSIALFETGIFNYGLNFLGYNLGALNVSW